MARHHDIDCLVDTLPMAEKINHVSTNVKGTTAAVVGMKVAVLAAEKAGTEHICKNVNRGFFTLMRSQMTQKIASMKSRTEALLIELYQQKKRLLDIKSTMERDYLRISSRYSRLITGINKSLKQRVIDLDRPIFDLCERDIATNNNRIALLTGTVPIGQAEGVVAAQQIISSVLKNNSKRVIEATKDFLYQMNEQKLITDKIVLTNIDAKDAEHAIPVIICSSTIDRNGNESTSITVPETTAQLSLQTIENELMEQSSQLQWKFESDDEKVKQEFNKLVAESNASTRVKDLVTKLYEKSQIQNL
jgi:hypothetical protein